jgi:integrase
MAAKKRRIRSPHPGVVLLDRVLPSGRKVVQARFVDPDSGKHRKPILDAVALPTQEARRLWAIRKSKAMAQRRMELEGGAARLRAVPLDEAIRNYFGSCNERLRENTLAAYKMSAKQFATWAAANGVRTTAEVAGPTLAAFREHLNVMRRQTSVRGTGAGRGKRTLTAARLSPHSINLKLRAVKTMVSYWRAHGLAARLTSDAIADALKAFPTERPQAEFLSPGQVQKLLEAAQRHDAAVFDETRDEHAGLRLRGTTRRYAPIAPFVAFLLLTGCRRGEALGLTWADVDLDAVDAQGRVVGEIRLRAADTKTHRARTIGLEVSPALRSMLAGMKLRAGHGAQLQHVFGGEQPYTKDLVEAARARLIGVQRERVRDVGETERAKYGAPDFDWQTLRSTCATYLTNAPGIFGAATVFLSARQLGHSVAVAERHYLGVHRGIPKDAHTLEAAMQIESSIRELIAGTSAHGAQSAAVVDMRGRVS